MAANNTVAELEDDYMVGPNSKIRITTQTCLLSFLLAFSILGNGAMLALFVRFKSLRRLSNYLLIDLTIVELLDTVVNIPIFMEFFLLTKKKNLERQTRWYGMLFHRYFLLNDLFTQLYQIVDCHLAIKFGKRFTAKKSSCNVKAFIALKWAVILAFLLVFSIPNYTNGHEYVSDEAYQRLLFGPNQVIWKIVIPSCQATAVIMILRTNQLIMSSRNVVYKKYGMRVFGKGSKNSFKAISTLTLIMVVQTVCKIPAAVYSYVAVDDRVEGNRWFAFFAYFCLFLSSSVMPVIYFWRSVAFRRALYQFRKHPLAKNAYLDYAAQHGLKFHRNGRLHLDKKAMRRNEIASPKLKEDCQIGNEPTKETDLSSRTTAQNTSRPLSMTIEASILELPMKVDFREVEIEIDDLAAERRGTGSGARLSFSKFTTSKTEETGVQVNKDTKLDDAQQERTFATSETGKVEKERKAVQLGSAESGCEEGTLNEQGRIMEKESILNANGASIGTTNNEDVSEPVGSNIISRLDNLGKETVEEEIGETGKEQGRVTRITENESPDQEDEIWNEEKESCNTKSRLDNSSKESVQRHRSDTCEEQVGLRITEHGRPIQKIEVSKEEEESLVKIEVQVMVHREASSDQVEGLFDKGYENLTFDTKL